MGLGRGVLQEIIALKRTGMLPGRAKVIEIGAQQLSNDFLRADAELDELAREFSLSAPPQLATPIAAGFTAAGLELQSDQAPASRAFWEAIGFQYAALDFDGHRDSCALDLNRDQVPAELHNKFDLAINTGTTEHVANQDHAFRVIHDLVRKGGVMLHELPAMGMPTHGLLTYTMKFFWHLCRENAYQVLRLEMLPGGIAPLPDNIVATNRQYGRLQAAHPFESEPIRDRYIAASLRKVTGAAYVTPLDVPADIMPPKPSGLVNRGLRQVWNRLRSQ
jgi:SAM-dependent methyltransferase